MSGMVGELRVTMPGMVSSTPLGGPPGPPGPIPSTIALLIPTPTIVTPNTGTRNEVKDVLTTEPKTQLMEENSANSYGDEDD